jgi:hypothetical protein
MHTFLIPLLLFTWFDWKTVKTDNFTVFYKPSYEWEAQQALTNLEHSRDRVAALTGNAPKRVPIVIEDIGTAANGFADPVFRNIHIYTYPPDGNSIGNTQNWYREVCVHEYTHICHLTKTSGFSRFLTAVLGTPFQPNMFAPGWVAEGITVYSESQSSPYEGRLNDGYFDSYIAASANEDKLPSIHTATYSPMEFPGGSGIYLYGGEFFNYLSQQYGEKRFAELFETYGSYFWAPLLGAVFPSVGIDMAAKRTYGKTLSHLFLEWKEHELEEHERWQMDGMRITRDGWSARYLTTHNGRLYYSHSHPHKTGALKQFSFNRIVELDPHAQEKRTVASLTSPVSGPIRIKADNLYYTTYEFERGYANVLSQGFGYTSVLHAKNLNTEKDRSLFSDRIRAFCPLEDGTVLYSMDKQHGFGSELWSYRDGKREQLWTTDYLIGELIANSTHIVASARRDFENWDVHFLDMENRRLQPILTTPQAEFNLNLHGDTVLFTANYDGTYSIYAYIPESGEFHQLTDKGYASNGVLCDSGLYFIGLTNDGFDIYETALEFTDCTLPPSPRLGSTPPWRGVAQHRPAPTPKLPPAVPSRQGGYSDVLKTLLKPAVHIPFIMPADTMLVSWFLGGLLVGADASHENYFALFLSHNPTVGEDSALQLTVALSSLLFSPLLMDIEYVHHNMARSRLSYPVLQRLSPGLSNVSLSLIGSAFDDDLSRKEITPGISLGFRFPRTKIAVKAEFPLEREQFGSDVKRTAQRLHFAVRRYAMGGEARLLAKGYNDPDTPDSVGIRMRGYSEPLWTKTGGLLSLEYSRPLLKIRRGFWNPNVFFEDLCLVLFTDVAFLSESRRPHSPILPLSHSPTPSLSLETSAGMELKLETGILFGFIKFAPAAGIALTRTGDVVRYIRIDLPALLK